MVELMAKLVHETMRQNRPLMVGFKVVPQFLTPYQRKVLQVDIFPIPLSLRYFSSNEVATLYAIHPRTVRKWAERGWIKPYRPTPNVTYYKGYELLSSDRFINMMAR